MSNSLLMAVQPSGQSANHPSFESSMTLLRVFYLNAYIINEDIKQDQTQYRSLGFSLLTLHSVPHITECCYLMNSLPKDVAHSFQRRLDKYLRNFWA